MQPEIKNIAGTYELGERTKWEGKTHFPPCWCFHALEIRKGKEEHHFLPISPQIGEKVHHSRPNVCKRRPKIRPIVNRTIGPSNKTAKREQDEPLALTRIPPLEGKTPPLSIQARATKKLKTTRYE